MRSISVLAIVTFLGGCPVELDVPDASIPEFDQAAGGAGGRPSTAQNPNAGAGAALGGRGPESGYAGNGAPPPDGGGLDPMRPPPSPDGAARIRLLLTDAPGDLQQLWVELVAIEGHVVASGREFWVPIVLAPRRLDLLTLRDGATERLGESLVPPGAYRQLRVRVGRQAVAVLEGGEQKPLPLAPEFAEQGVLVTLGIEARGGVTYTILLDFDGAESVRLGDMGPVLAPVIRVKEISEMRSEDSAEMYPRPAPDGGVGEPPPPDGGMREPPPDGGELPPPPAPEPR